MATFNLEKEKKKAYRQGLRDAERNCAIILLFSLHDEFGFGPKRLLQAVERISNSGDALFSKYCTLQDMQQVLHDECGIEMVKDLGTDYKFTDIVDGKCIRCHSPYTEGNYCPWCGAEILEVRE